MFKITQILLAGITAAILLTACGKKEEAPAVPAPVATEVVPTVPVPGADEAAPAATALSADGIPIISKDVEYPAYRKSLIKADWIPVKQVEQCGFVCQGYRTSGYKETEDCGDAGLAPCTFIFKNKEGETLKVNTAGENLSVTRAVKGGAVSTASSGVAGLASNPIDKKQTQSTKSQSSLRKEVNPTAYFKALNSSFGPSGWAECVNGAVTVQAVSIKYNQTLPVDVQKATRVVEDTLGAMRQQMLIDGVSQTTLDSLVRSQPAHANGDQGLKVVGGCYQKMKKVLYSLQ